MDSLGKALFPVFPLKMHFFPLTFPLTMMIFYELTWIFLGHEKSPETSQGLAFGLS